MKNNRPYFADLGLATVSPKIFTALIWVTLFTKGVRTISASFSDLRLALTIFLRTFAALIDFSYDV
jgi:hypothetical protein